MNIEEIKLKWQKHNRDHGMSWNEVAELVNEVIQPAVSEGEITKLWERFSFVHESSDEDFTVRLMTKPEFEIAVQSLNVQGDAQQRYNMARERQEGYIEGYNYAKGLKEEDKSHVNAVTQPAVSEGAQQRYEKALQYVERAVHIDGELDQDKALRIAAGLKEGDKP